MRIWAVVLLLAIPGLGGGINRKNKEGSELYKEGKLDEALAAFTQAQVDSPDASEIHYNIGNVHYRKQEMDKALQEYRAALRGESDLERLAHYNTGNVHYRGQDFDAAVQAYKEALKIGPDDIEARQNLELALQRKKDQQEKQEQSGGGGGGGQDKEDKKDEEQEQQSQQRQDTQEQQQMSQSQREPREIRREEAEQILAALAEMEKAEQRRQQEKKRAKVRVKVKDW